MRTLVLFAIGLIFGGGIGFVTAAGLGVSFDGHDHDDHIHHGGGMDHDAPLEVGDEDAPTVQVAINKDPMSGYNMLVSVENFQFAPHRASLAHEVGEGHAHLYVNGVKQARLYGPWVHIPDLPSGEVIVEVTLNSNNHRPLAVNGEPVAARITLHTE